MEKQKNVPVLRFLGFEGNWEEKKLGEVSAFTNGKGHENDISESGKYIVINSKFISTDGAIKKYSDKAFSLLHKEQIVMVMSDVPNGKAIAKCFFINKDDTYTLNQRICSLYSKELNNKFLFYRINRHPYYLEFDNGVGQTNLRKDEVLNCPIFFPKNILEQTKIANFLTEIDTKIQQLTQKKTLLEEYKKGVMQQIFSQNIRFKSDNGEDYPDWKEKKLEDLTENGFSNGAFNDPKKVGTGYRIINVKDMYVDGTIDIEKLTRVAIDEKEFLKNRVEYGDIFFTRSSLVKEGIAHSNVNLNDADDLTFDGHLIRMRPKKKEYLPLFLYYSFTTLKVRTQFIIRGKTTTMTTIGQEDIASVEINIPSLPEQTKIANFLTAIDTKIQTVAKQIEQTQAYKKGLLQQLFV